MMYLKRVAAASICMAIVMAATGCNGKTAEESTTKQEAGQDALKEGTEGAAKDTQAGASGEKTSITYWEEMNTNTTSVVKSYNEVASMKAFGERTGLSIEFLHPPVGQAAEQFKLLIASKNDLPDVIEVDWLKNYPGGPEKAIKDGIIIPLNDYIDEMPNFKKVLEGNPDFAKESKTDEGNIFAIHGINENSIRSYSGLMVRKDWLDELNLPVPETIGEWETVLREFRDKKNVSVPFTTVMWQLNDYNLFNTAYGVGSGFYLGSDGKVKYGPVEPGYKEYLTMMNRWYAEGLLDPDFMSIDTKMVKSHMMNGEAGVVFDWIGGGMGTFYSGTSQEGFELTAVSNPVLQKGDKPGFLPEYVYTSTLPGLAVTSNAKDVPAILKAVDYLYSDEGRILKNYGIEGETYEMKDGKPVYTDLIMKNLENLSIAVAMAKYTQANYPTIGYCNDPDYLEQYYTLDAQKEALVNVNKYADEAASYVLPRISATPDESKELASIMSEVDIYRQEKFIAFITGVEPLDNFDSYVEEMKRMGIDRAAEIKQAGVERYNVR